MAGAGTAYSALWGRNGAEARQGAERHSPMVRTLVVITLMVITRGRPAFAFPDGWYMTGAARGGVIMAMDVFEAVESRIACRWFLDKPVDANIVRDLIERAARAASGGNLQSWQVYALSGGPLAELKARVATHIAGRDPRHDDAEYPIYPPTMWEPYKSRREAHGVQLYGALGIARDDAEGRLAQYKRNFAFFNAPVALFIAIDRQLGPGQWADLGGYIHALMFLARGYGLDTCPQESWARMHRIVGEFVTMPPEQMLFCAVAIGYCDRDHAANSFRSPRADLAEFCTFLGFD